MRRLIVSAGIASLLLMSASVLAAEPAAPALGVTPPEATDNSPPADGVYDLVMTERYEAVYETPDRKECPNGLEKSFLQQYRAAYPTEEARKAHDAKYAYYANAGPNGENVFFNPTLFKDPLPWSEVTSPTAIGLNLDGKVGPHDFTGPRGETGVDNQLYRVIGCIAGYAAKGSIKATSNDFIRISQYNRLLLRVTGVHSLVNQPNVEVSVYRGLDPISQDANKNGIPWRTQRVDTRDSARFETKLKGHIVDGYLITEPKDVVMPVGPEPQIADEQPYRQMRLKVKLSATAAEGVMGGYDDMHTWFMNVSKLWGAGSIAEFAQFSPVSMYAALQRYADAYPDPKTGQNTGISSAYVVKFVRTIITFPPADTRKASNVPVRPLASVSAPERVVQEWAPASVKLQYTDYGFTYADAASGKTLYTWGGDNPGKSKCGAEHIVNMKDGIGTGGMLAEPDKRPTCEQAWPPALAPAGFQPQGKWSTIDRANGTKQLAYGGMPLYTAVIDDGPAELNGWGPYGIGNGSGRMPLWAKVESPPQIQVVVTDLGRTLATTTMGGMTLYTFDGDTPKTSACEGECLKSWTPFMANELAQPVGDWSLVTRSDDTPQWAYRGHPLYTYVGDEHAQDVSGHGVGKWRAAVIQPMPAHPAALAVGVTTAGDVLTDTHGKTVYRFLCTEYSADRLNCDGKDSTQLYRLTICGGPEKCGQTWKVIPASTGARSPNKVWSIVDVDPVSGVFCTNRQAACTQKVWAYMGRPVYTYAGDARPGDFDGDQVRTFPYGFVRLRPDGKVEP
jgi:predicted lipoprotein with Yx(FWY)xxD motif